MMKMYLAQTKTDVGVHSGMYNTVGYDPPSLIHAQQPWLLLLLPLLLLLQIMLLPQQLLQLLLLLLLLLLSDLLIWYIQP